MTFKITAYELKEKLETIISWSATQSTLRKELEPINSNLLSQIKHILGGENSSTEVTGLIGHTKGVSESMLKVFSDNLARNTHLSIPHDLLAIINKSQAQESNTLDLAIRYLKRACDATKQVTLETDTDHQKEHMISDLEFFKKTLGKMLQEIGHFQVTIEKIPLSTTPENQNVSRLHLSAVSDKSESITTQPVEDIKTQELQQTTLPQSLVKESVQNSKKKGNSNKVSTTQKIQELQEEIQKLRDEHTEFKNNTLDTSSRKGARFFKGENTLATQVEDTKTPTSSS